MMSESVSAATTCTATTATSTISENNTNNERSRRFITNKKRCNPKPRAKYKGAEEGMQGHIFDVERTGKPCEFITTVEYLKGYVSRKYDNAKLLEKILTDFEEEELIEPADPDDTPAGLFRWQLEMKEYYKDKSDLEKLKFAVWALIWGQCTEIVRKKLKALTDL